MLVSRGIIIKKLSGGGGGGGGGQIDVYTKKHGRTLGQRGTGCSTRTLASAHSNCSDTTKNPKMTQKEEAQFLLPPPPHTHTCASAIHKGSVFEKCFRSEVITSVTLKRKICPYPPPPQKIYQTPPPLCVL